MSTKEMNGKGVWSVLKFVGGYINKVNIFKWICKLDGYKNKFGRCKYNFPLLKTIICVSSFFFQLFVLHHNYSI